MSKVEVRSSNFEIREFLDWELGSNKYSFKRGYRGEYSGIMYNVENRSSEFELRNPGISGFEIEVNMGE